MFGCVRWRAERTLGLNCVGRAGLLDGPLCHWLSGVGLKGLTGVGTYLVRRVGGDDWQAARDLRLEALGDPAAAVAFLTRLGDAVMRSDDEWRQRTLAAAKQPDVAQFVAVDAEGHLVGSATGLRPSQDRAGQIDSTNRPANVVAVYVQPRHRGCGAVRHLLEATEAWLRDCGEQEAVLHVHEQNLRAHAAYVKHGYVDTGVRIPVEGGWEREMVQVLNPSKE